MKFVNFITFCSIGFFPLQLTIQYLRKDREAEMNNALTLYEAGVTQIIF